MIGVRLMRPRSPCCIPRLKRRMATLGDGYFFAFSANLYTPGMKWNLPIQRLQGLCEHTTKGG